MLCFLPRSYKLKGLAGLNAKYTKVNINLSSSLNPFLNHVLETQKVVFAFQVLVVMSLTICYDVEYEFAVSPPED